MLARPALLLALTLTAGPALANPLDAIRNKLENGDTMKRLPNDNIEGTIWEYQGTLEKGELDGQKKATIAGMFRSEGEALFAVGGVIRLPGIEDIKKAIEALRKGEPKLIRLPTGKPKRIGDFSRSRSGRLTLKFDDESEDPDALYGTMILRPKKGQTSVFLGDFQEKEGKKTVRTWQMTVRTVQD